MREHTAVILCGGRGQRLGSLGDQLPKALIEVRGRPILWYIVARLYLEGFRHFILPLGYRGDQIQGFIDRNLTEWDVRIDAIPTGESTEVGLRLQRVRHLLPQTSFLLINGDTLFDFPVASVMSEHEASGMAITLMSCPVVSQFGLLVMDGDRVIDFTRDSLVRSFQVLDPNGGGALHRAYVNSGIALLRPNALDAVDLAATKNFESELYGKLIAQAQARHHPIEGYWFAIDTPKDVEIANALRLDDPRSAGALDLNTRLSRAQQELFKGIASS
jgi:glucose-1-phosphate cytidylyltransferase